MHRIIASFVLYTKLPLKHFRMRFVFFLWESHLTDSYSVPPQPFLCCIAVEMVMIYFGPVCLVSMPSPFLNYTLLQSPLQASSPVSPVHFNFWSLLSLYFQKGWQTPNQLPSFTFCPLFCCLNHSRKCRPALGPELQEGDPPSWQSEALIITLDYGTSTCVDAAQWSACCSGGSVI